MSSVFFKRVSSAGVLLVLFTSFIPGLAIADESSINRGKALYYGDSLQVRHIADKTAITASNLSKVAACVGCHRPSALGGFEGGVAVPPVAGHFLFSSYEPLTVNRFPWPTTLRKRPAYTPVSLHDMLNSGVTIDGKTVSALMPRYSFSKAEVEDLADFLKNKTNANSPGVTAQYIRFATITTPDVSDEDRLSLIQTLNIFFTDKNAETRSESKRRNSSLINNENMYKQYRKWELEHWVLTGSADSWQAQLDSYYSKNSVFAIISGVGGVEWQPVHDFCEKNKIPCILPQTSFAPVEFNFYNLYFDAGLYAQLQWVQKNHAEKPVKFSILTNSSLASKYQEKMASAQLLVNAKSLLEVDQVNADVLISFLSVEETARKILQHKLSASTVYILHLAQSLRKPEDWNNTMLESAKNSTWHIIDRFYSEEKLASPLRRANIWLKSKKFAPQNGVIAANALFAATLAADTLAHADSNFSREYCVEKLEHGIENSIALSAYSRLSLSANQRLASNGFAVHTKNAGRNEFLPTWINPK